MRLGPEWDLVLVALALAAGTIALAMAGEWIGVALVVGAVVGLWIAATL